MSVIDRAIIQQSPTPHSPTTTECGATMVEFAISLIVIILAFGAIFDLGLGVHRYAMLKQVTNESTRQIAARLQTHRDCSFIETYLREIATVKLTKHLAPGSVPSWQTQWDIASSDILYPVFRLQSSMNMQCFFLCSIFPNGIPVATSSEIVIERQGIGVGGHGCPPVRL